MSWHLDAAKNLYLRSLVLADIDVITDLNRRAFASDSIADNVHSMLTIYCHSDAVRVPLEQQTGTLLPVSYYIMALNEQEGECIVGITGLYRPIWAGEGVFWLGWFAIAPQFQGYGYGSHLLNVSMELARGKGGRLLCVETSINLSAALHLYEKMGFHSCNVVSDYWRSGVSLIILARDLHDISVPQGMEIL
jgi:GNAT superfamily N-acetyltransferase